MILSETCPRLLLTLGQNRGQEVVSEEPLVCAEYAAYYIPGLQGIVERGGGKLPFLKSVATAKHFFDYDLEGIPPQTRQQIYVNVTARDQTEYFLPPFESSVKRGKVLPFYLPSSR